MSNIISDLLCVLIVVEKFKYSSIFKNWFFNAILLTFIV